MFDIVITHYLLFFVQMMILLKLAKTTVEPSRLNSAISYKSKQREPEILGETIF